MKWRVRRKTQRNHRKEERRIERLQQNRFTLQHTIKHEYGQRPQNRRPTQVTVWFRTSQGTPHVMGGRLHSGDRSVYLNGHVPSYVETLDRIDFEFDER